MLFLDRLFKNCSNYAAKVALEFLRQGKSQKVTYQQLETYINAAASYLLSLDVQAGDRVAIQLPKSLEFIFLHVAAMRIGAISLPLNPAFTASELDYYLRDSEAKVFIGDKNRQDEFTIMLDNLALEYSFFLNLDQNLSDFLLFNQASNEVLPSLPSDAHATALMIYTSGTTGRPKGAELSHENLTTSMNALDEAWAWEKEDVLLHVLPIFHTHGLMVALHGALNAGASTVMLGTFDAKTTLELLEFGNFSVFMAVPTIHHRLLEEAKRPYDLSSIRLMTSGSARLADDVFLSFKERFNYTLLERYGMTETGMNLSNPYKGERRCGSVGLPLPGVEARVVDPATGQVLADDQVGEVQIRGKHVFKGYWQQPEKTAEAFTPDGWLRTGDLGLREKDGYYTLKGRSKDLIISGGYNVYPPEVELILAKHPDLLATTVIGCPDKDWGERVVAIVIKGDATQLTENDIIAFCKEQLANYKTPKEVHFVKDFPRNAMGKVQKAKLREKICGS